MKRLPASFALLVVFSQVSPAQGESKRVRLLPQLRAGQSLDYLVNLQTDRNIKAQSSVVTPNLPAGEKLSVVGRIHVEVLLRESIGFRLRTTLEPFPSASASPKPAAGEKPPPHSAPQPAVEFTLQDDGGAANITGLDQLPAEQRSAWQEWLARFAASMTYPKNGVKPGDTWKSQEQETAPSPIGQLVWQKKSEYVRNEPCPSARITPQDGVIETGQNAETCAVILTTAILRQKSSPKDATPGEYKKNNLRTAGKATGKNETILYISRSTGLLMRSSETATQSMDAVIALADGSNQVRYNIRAQSRARLVFLQTGSAAHP